MPKPEVMRLNLTAGRTHMSVERPNVVYRPHGMVGWILNYTADGCGRINRGNDGFSVTPGDWLLFPPEVIHDYGAADDPGDWVHLWVYFTPRSHWLGWLDWEEATLGVRHLYVTKGRRLDRLQRRFEELIRHAHGHQARRYDFALNALEEMLLWLDTFNPRAERKHLDSRIQTAVDRLCTEFDKPFNLEELAATCGLSPSRFAHLFRRQVGSAPGQFLKQQRLQRARELLLMTQMPVSEVARAVGYDNPFYFTRLFAEQAQMSPRAFRRRGWQ